MKTKTTAMKTRRGLTMTALALVLLAGLAMGGAAGASSLGNLPSNAEDAIRLALKSNPQIVLAEAKVRTAQAELNAAKLSVSRDIAELFARRTHIHRQLEALEANLERTKMRVKQGVSSSAEMQEAIIALAQTSGELQGFDAQLRYLIGDGGRRVDEAQQKQSKRRTIAIRHRPEFDPAHESWLSTQLNASFDDVPISDALKYVEATVGGKMTFVFNDEVKEYLESEDVRVSMSEATLRDVLWMLSDVASLPFVQRDYGFRVVWMEEAVEMNLAAIPSDLKVKEYEK